MFKNLTDVGKLQKNKPKKNLIFFLGLFILRIAKSFWRNADFLFEEIAEIVRVIIANLKGNRSD